MKEMPVLRVTAKFLIPLIMLFAFYVQFHGDYSPGGGFQAGVIFGAAFILYGLIYGVESARRVIPPRVLYGLVCGGVLLYAGVGFATLLMGGAFLEYNVLAADPVTGQHVGIIIIELGVGITVAATMATIFFMFAGRERRQWRPSDTTTTGS